MPVAYKAVPAAKEGRLPARVAAAPDRITPSPIAKTRNPAATQSLPFLKNFTVNNEAAITTPAPSMPTRFAEGSPG